MSLEAVSCLHPLLLLSSVSALQLVQTGVSSSPFRASPDRYSMIWEGFGPTGTTKEIQKEWVRFPGSCIQTTALKWDQLRRMTNQAISRASLLPLWLAWADVHIGFSFSQADTKNAKTPSQTGGRLCIWILLCPFPWQASYWVAHKKEPLYFLSHQVIVAQALRPEKCYFHPRQSWPVAERQKLKPSK